MQQNPRDIFTENDLRYGKLKVGLGPVVKCRLALDEQEQKQLLDRMFVQPLPLTDKAEAYQQLAPALEVVELISEWRETDRQSYIKLGPMFIKGNYVSAQVPSGGSTRPLRALIVELRSSGNTLEEVLHTRDLWESTGIQQGIGELISSRFKSFAEFRYRSCAVDRSNALESLSGSETASVLLNLKNHRELHLRKRYDVICTEFSKFFPSLRIEAVERELGGRIADVQFIEKGKDWPIPLDNIGAGVTELLTFVTNIVAREGYIFVIEEPELHLHPQAKRRLHKLIKESATKNQVFVITHDPYFVDSDNLHAVTRFSITGQGTQVAFLPNKLSPKVRGQLKTAMKDPAKREVVFARAVLLVEDESQQNFIIGSAEKLPYDLDSSGVSVIPVGGGDGFEPYVKLLDALRIPKLCLRDLGWGSTANRPPEVFRSLGCELEKFLEQAGLGQLMEHAQRKVGNNKPRKAKYVGEHVAVEKIPSFFSKLIADAIELANNR